MFLNRSAMLLVASAALAAPVSATVVFSGHDANNGGVLLANPIADAANAAFLASLTDVRTASFEGFRSGARLSSVSFTGSGGTTVAGLSGAGNVMAGGTRATPFADGSFAIDGNNLYQLGQSSFTIAFDQAVDALGFYATDIETNALALVTLGSGAVETYSFDTLFNSSNAGSGSVDFLGFSSDLGIRSLTLVHSSIPDVYGFDNFQIGRTAIRPDLAVVPEPMTWAMFALGFGLMGGVMRRRRAVRVRFA
jgi:hypothetical protein